MPKKPWLKRASLKKSYVHTWLIDWSWAGFGVALVRTFWTILRRPPTSWTRRGRERRWGGSSWGSWRRWRLFPQRSSKKFSQRSQRQPRHSDSWPAAKQKESIGSLFTGTGAQPLIRSFWFCCFDFVFCGLAFQAALKALKVSRPPWPPWAPVASRYNLSVRQGPSRIEIFVRFGFRRRAGRDLPISFLFLGCPNVLLHTIRTLLQDQVWEWATSFESTIGCPTLWLVCSMTVNSSTSSD